MNPDWYVDPLGRYEGRYWNGDDWTEKVKERGRLVIDPDWPPVAEAATAARAAAGPAGWVAESIGDDTTEDTPLFDDSPIAAVEPFSTSTPASISVTVPGVELGDATAESRIDPRFDGIDFATESPTVQVAVLEAEVAGSSSVGSVGAVGSAASVTVAEQGAAQAGPAEITTMDRPRQDHGDRVGHVESVDPRAAVAPPSRLKWYLLAAVLVALALLLALLPRLTGSSDEVADDPGAVELGSADPAGSTDSADPPDDGSGLPATEPDTAVPADGTADSTADDPADDTAADPADDTADDMADDTADRELRGSDSMLVGPLEVLNARPMLRDLTAWHASWLGDDADKLGPNAGCWFGTIGEAVVQNAHCGPVAGSPEPRFDLVPLRFEDVEPGVIQVRPLTEAVVADQVLPGGLELLGTDGPIDPQDLVSAEPDESEDPDDAGGRGDRGSRDSGG